MIRTESLERPTSNARYEAEAAPESLPLADGTDSTVPDWDNLWVDIGGEG
jgi:hypothetical protein